MITLGITTLPATIPVNVDIKVVLAQVLTTDQNPILIQMPLTRPYTYELWLLPGRLEKGTVGIPAGGSLAMTGKAEASTYSGSIKFQSPGTYSLIGKVIGHNGHFILSTWQTVNVEVVGQSKPTDNPAQKPVPIEQTPVADKVSNPPGDINNPIAKTVGGKMVDTSGGSTLTILGQEIPTMYLWGLATLIFIWYIWIKN